MAVTFESLKSAEGLSGVNDYLADKSYLDGFQPSQADNSIYEAITLPPGSDLPHLLRWYNHVKSFSKDVRRSWPGAGTSVSVSGGGDVAANGQDEEEEEINLFDSDEEDDPEKERIKAERVAAYQAKKAKKPTVIAKSSIILDVKPWDDETDLKEMERMIREIKSDGLVWGASKFVPVAYGVQKLQIGCVVEDDKVGMDFLEEHITELEDFVQSVDVVAFNKI